MAPTGARHARPARRKADFLQITGELLLTLGVVFFLFAFYEAYWTNIASGKEQAQASEQLNQQWGERVNPRQKITPELGSAFARMYIPSFGSDFQFAIVEGTEDSDLEAGPGHYVNTPLPGVPGNFAVAGHRVGKGAPFNDLGNLKVCDAVVVETQTAWNVYRILPIDSSGDQRRQEAAGCLSDRQVDEVTTGAYANVQGRYITDPGDVSTIAAIPGTDLAQTADRTPDPTQESLITLTTCHPQFSNAERMIVHGMLTEQIPKHSSGTRPAVLEES